MRNSRRWILFGAVVLVVGAASPAWAPLLRLSVPDMQFIRGVNHVLDSIGVQMSLTGGESLDPPLAGFSQITFTADVDRVTNNSALELLTQGATSFSPSATLASIRYLRPDGPMPQDGAALPGVTVTISDAPAGGVHLRIGTSTYRVTSLDSATLQLARIAPGGGDIIIDVPIKDRLSSTPF